jgi:ABC-type bacteriocin/lantibiotic exporter with double-glycine peptidase domain
MGSTVQAFSGNSAIKKIFSILKLEKKEISTLYFYAILNGLIQLSLPLGIQSIISFVMASSLSTSLVLLICFVIFGVFCNGFISVKQLQLIEKIQQKIFVRYAIDYTNRIPHIDLKETDAYYLPELVNRFFDSVTLQKGISKILLDFPVATIQIIFGLLLLSFYHPIFISFGFILTALVVAMLYFSGSKGLESSINESDYKYKVAGWIQELARFIVPFKMAGQSSLHLRNTDKYLSGYLKFRTDHFKVLLFQFWTIIGFKMIITAAMLIVGSALLISQQINIGQFIGAEIVILLIINSVEKLIINLDNVYDVLTATEKLSKFLEKPVEPAGGTQFMLGTSGMKINLHQVHFQYSPDTPPIQIASLSISAGSKIVISGEDGSGKSTLIKLLSGQYADFDGGIYVNDISLMEYDLQSYRAHVGLYLGQQDLFDGTLKDNITLGNEAVHESVIVKMAGIVGLDEFLTTLPTGLKTMVNSAGKGLARNVIQKILLLRALVSQPPLLLLDEPWLGLEAEHVSSIQSYLLNDCTNATVLIITADKNFASRCDDIIEL